MDKEGVVYTYSEILLSHGKEWNLAICNKWMDLAGIVLSEISQAEEDKYCMMSLIWKIQKTSDYNKKETDSQM